MDNLEEFFIYDGGNAVFNTEITVGVDTDVPLVLEHRLEAVAVELGSFGGAVSFVIEQAANVSHGITVGVELERFLYDGSANRVNDQFVIFDFIAERDMTTDAVTLHG